MAIPVGRRWSVDRQFFVVAHRWVGLVMAGFLLLAGVTGALLVWNDALDEAISPALFRVTPPSADAVPMDPIDLVERVQAQYPRAQVVYAPLRVEPGRTLTVYLAANAASTGMADASAKNAGGTNAGATNAGGTSSSTANASGTNASSTNSSADSPQHEDALANDQVFVDPYRGVVVGERLWGDIGQGWKNLMPFLYRLHFSLALDTIGSYVFGGVALLWTVDCFVGAYLTFPAALKKKRRDSKSWRRRWWPSWKVRWDGGAYKVNVDLHRAGGLWVWAMLFVLAWSSVAFNLSEVHDPVMRSVLAYQPEVSEPRVRRSDAAPVMDWRSARETGRRLMAEHAPAQVPAVVVLKEEALGYDASAQTYRYVVRSDRDIRDHRGSTRLTFDAHRGADAPAIAAASKVDTGNGTGVGTSADSGRLVHLWLPTGAAAGDTVRTWLTSLHMAAVWGLPFDVFVTVMGAVVALLSVTGVVIWWKKWRGRRVQAARDALTRHAAANPGAEASLGGSKAARVAVHTRVA